MVLLWLMLSFGACSPQMRDAFPGLSAVSHELTCPVQRADEPADEREPEHQPAWAPEQRSPARERTAEPPEWEI
jgi:hypothetical protein